MSGHSKWHSIKHKKAIIDSKRGKVFTKIIKELMVAARLSGSDPDANPRLRTAIQAAKDVNMPKDTMERAIKKGAGELEGVSFEEITYEGYTAGGGAILVKITTDNRNRTAGEVKFAFGKYGGNMGTPGCVGFLFTKRGLIDVEGAEEDALMEIALDAGAEDIENQGEGYFLVSTPWEHVQQVRESLEKKGVKVTSSAVKMVPGTMVKIGGEDAERIQKFLDWLDNYDDVDDVATNVEFEEQA